MASEPPLTSTVSGAAAGRAAAPAASSRAASSRRTGLPVIAIFLGLKKRRLSSNDRNTRRTRRPRILLVSPGIEFCSQIAVGTPPSRAISTTGPEA